MYSPAVPPPKRPVDKWGLINNNKNSPLSNNLITNNKNKNENKKKIIESPPLHKKVSSTTNLPNMRHPNIISKSWSVAAGLATPDQWAPSDRSRHTLYGSIPFTSVMGLQTKPILSDNLKDIKADLEADSAVLTIPLIIAIICAMAAEFLVGYNTSVMNGVGNDVFPNHTQVEWSLAVSIFAIGGPFGAYLAGYFANHRGRREALIINAWIYLIGGLLQTFAFNIYYIIVARFIIGMGGGYACVLVPIYLGELAPPTLRGTLGTCTQLALVVGILVSDILVFPFSTPKRWRYLFSITPILSILMLFLSKWLVESPRWLLANPNPKKASLGKSVLRKIRGFRSTIELDKEVNHIQYASEIAKTRHESAHGYGAIYDIFINKSIRIFLITSLFLQMTQQLTGINAVFYYSTSIFEGMISSPQTGTCIVALVNVLATYLALLLMDKTPRRVLLLWSAVGMLISGIVLMFSLAGYLTNIISLISIMLYVGFFEIGLGPIPWLIVTEMFDAKYVATVMAVATQVNWTCNFLVGISYPFLNAYLGPWSFIPFTVVIILTILFVYFIMPETLTLGVLLNNDVENNFDHNNPKNNFESSNNSLIDSIPEYLLNYHEDDINDNDNENNDKNINENDRLPLLNNDNQKNKKSKKSKNKTKTFENKHYGSIN